MKANFPIARFSELETPFYFYDANLLRETLDKIKEEAGKYNKFCVHYAVKPMPILKSCVSSAKADWGPTV